uniref:CDC20/Fizzy WD40 domain-containing protein n=1 Tax=Tetraselmis chuii TaxID=63592 RepID=A0A7S1T1G7_9CHLO|mmetsp:Transcript_38946/g.69750  ORF Transcript_38946/g.69750 Transcript_38946/m.69750 type:complete len:508 (+) Transcript_38946:168-1691(+)
MTAEAGSSGRGAEGGLGRTQSDGGLLSGLGASLTKTPSGVRATHYSDRFIPSRSASNLSYQLLTVPGSGGTPEVAQNAEREDSAAAYTTMLRNGLLGGGTSGSGELPGSPKATGASSTNGGGSAECPRSPCSPAKKMLRFKSGGVPNSFAGIPTPSPYLASPSGIDAAHGVKAGSSPRSLRKIARSPFKVLDAPCLQDDFYLNLVDWSAQNVLAVGLGASVYLWSACTSKVTKLCDLGANDEVCSVAWTQRGTYLAIGTFRDAEVQIWDVAKCRKLRTLSGHRNRVGTLAWSSQLLASGSRDRTILRRDVRAKEPFVAKLQGHRSEVCGLKWSYDDRELASGGNDNQLLIWNVASPNPVMRFSKHCAAVKAIAWSPHNHGVLASGGGTADRCIRFWNTTTSSEVSCMDTGSQVCNLAWSKNVNELVSTHGYSQNQVVVWRYPTMSKLATLTGHTMRVLYLAISPDGQTIVTGAGDETLRFWNIFPGPKAQGGGNDSSVSSLTRTVIR